MATAILLSCVLALAGSVNCLSDPTLPSIFFPFGPDAGDGVVPVADDASSPGLHISDGFPFFNVSRNITYVNSNGQLSFGASIHNEYTPRPLPILSLRTPLIAPYWADVDTTVNDGRIYYRNVTDASTLRRVSRDVVAVCPSFSSFLARWAMVATWHNVTFHGASRKPPQTNTFQAVLTTDGRMSFVMFHYGNLSWTTGTLSGGSHDTGLGSNEAVVGFNNGDGVNYYMHPSSLTGAIRFIFQQSNVGTRGRYVYRVDSRNISSVPCRVHSPSSTELSTATTTTTRSSTSLDIKKSSTATTTTTRSSTSLDIKKLLTATTTRTRSFTSLDINKLSTDTSTTTRSSTSLDITSAILERGSNDNYLLVVILAVVCTVLLVAVIIIVIGCYFKLHKVYRRADMASRRTAASNDYCQVERDTGIGSNSAQTSENTRDEYITVNDVGPPYQNLRNSGQINEHLYELASPV